MTYLVTGVSGFVGRRLARHLLATGERVIGTFTGGEPTLPGVELHPIDILDGEAMSALVAATAPELVIHLAGLSHVGSSWRRPGEYFQVNVLGTERLLAAAAGRRVVVASSAEVYGVVPEDEQPIRETRVPAPANPYALTKAAAERLAVAAGAVIARTFNLVGPGQSPTFALPAFAAQLAAIERGEQEPVLAVGNLAARRDFLHVDDGVAGFCRLATAGEPGQAYNVASGRALAISEMLERLLAVSGVDARVEPDPERFRPLDVPLMTGDAGRLEALGWCRQHTVDDALAELWQAARSGRGD